MVDENRNGIDDRLEGYTPTGPPTSAGARTTTTTTTSGGGTPAPARDPEAMRGESPLQGNTASIRELQQMLLNLGYNPGPIDGLWGPKTQAAMNKFQADQGMAATQTFDMATRAAIMRVATQSTPAQGSQGTAELEPGAAAPTGAEAAAATPPATPLSDADADQRIRELYPQFVAYLDHPELGPILRQAAEKGMTGSELAGMVYNTEYWKTTPSTARAWEQLHATDPATASGRLLERVSDIIKMASRMGYEFDGNTNLMLADQAIRYGWDEPALEGAVVAQIQKTYGKGDTPLNAGTIKSVADQLWAQSRQYLVPVSRKTVEQWALDIQAGKKTAEGFTAWVSGLSKGRFPWLTKEIEGGNTPERYFASHQQKIADILEISADEIDWMDKQWSGILDFNDANGNRRSMSLSEVDDWARRNPRYRYTNQANEKGYNMLSGLLEDFGLV